MLHDGQIIIARSRVQGDGPAFRNKGLGMSSKRTTDASEQKHGKHACGKRAVHREYSGG
jgi:hypothetical protein